MINVIFDLLTSGGKQVHKRIHISPLNSPIAYSGSYLVVEDTVVESYGNMEVTVPLIPNAYSIRIVGYNNVQTDRQWQRRCKEEVLQLLDSYAGSKADRIYE